MIAAAITAGLGAAAAALAVATRGDRVLLPDCANQAGRAVRGAPRRVLGAVGALPLVRSIANVERLSARARLADPAWSIDELAGAKIGASLAAAGPALLAPAALRLLAVPLAVLCFWIPDLALARSARRRLAAADREVPVLLDLLAVATSAGLAPQLALRRASAAVRGPLAEELAVAIRAADLGSRWRDELHAVGDRLPVRDLRRTVAALQRAEALGSSLAEDLRRLASEVREARRAAAAERARTAPVKMLFPLVFLILPAFLLLTVVPALVTTVQSIR